MAEDIKFKCIDCSTEFVWSAREQKFWEKNGLTNPPKRCPPCRQKKRQRNAEKEKQDQQRG